MMRALASAALSMASLAAGVAEAAPQFAGLYKINQMEMAGGLELSANGHFRYVFDYGAVSEQSEGNWVFDGDTVLLTTNPMPEAAECDRGFASACFRQTPLVIEGDELILRRWDARIVLKPVQPRPR